ncbi:hypothetical protein D0N37_14275 [Pseudoalteromonas piscicida]|nr:hypothetical protein D0N37_14275 [Pseudoalteromonas piscicida]
MVNFSNLTLTFVNALKAQASQGVYYAFSKEELIEVLLRCTDFSLKKSDQIISLFTNEKSLLKTSDLYLKPLYEKDGKIHLCVPALLTGQFTRVVDFYINNEVEPAVSNQKTQNKGKFFELDFGHELTTQIDNNEVLSNIFCKVLKIGFDQEKGKDNEEIDIVLRIGETYLIIEAKSFTYRVGSSGFKNNLETLKESKLGRKKEFFIEEYQRFKEIYDPTANFLLDEEKVLCCYLSSSPHGVGILVNDFPVVDPSILERYFGIGSFTLVDSKKGNKEFLFYKNTREAETNLKRYLKELPQLYHYKNCFGYSNTYFHDFYEGKKVEFSEALFDFRTARVQREIDTLWDLADCWHTSNGLHT